ncbi:MULTISPECIES: hypothetical protein [unclassified Neochlamydia]|uniref:hypothetical protein n=1 Tax=unclassified Neochlamydia TaxID=2643326 RepID=UPI001BC9F0B2|nr:MULTISPECIES: hypothetical protein [unclassified Neochlamydia]MBS4165179.1 Uncharacterized protein [Neochlamydia sp. AcF65]MBS4170491.1 Uncharacterized protein [Neochlamydia sp. AcF95]
MSISGSGTGAPGGIPEFSLLNEQNAASYALRLSMGIANNLDSISFTEIDKQALWKYDTSSSKPTLHPLEHMRVEVTPPRADDSWKQMLAEITERLPPNVRAAYEQSLQAPIEERNPSLIALGKLLEGAAKVFNGIQSSANALDSQNPIAAAGSPLDLRRQMNLELAEKALQGILKDSFPTFEAIKNSLASLGPNDPFFDELMGAANQLGMAYSTLAHLHNKKAAEDHL